MTELSLTTLRDTAIQSRLPGTARPLTPEERSRLRPERRPRAILLPGPEELEKILLRAVEALRNGIYWDRGSIVNVVL